jgi:hypothetical protein
LVGNLSQRGSTAEAGHCEDRLCDPIEDVMLLDGASSILSSINFIKRLALKEKVLAADHAEDATALNNPAFDQLFRIPCARPEST